MFDDSKRLDKLETQMASLFAVSKADRERDKAEDANTVQFSKGMEQLNKNTETAAGNFKIVVSRLEALEKDVAALKADNKKLQTRTAHLEQQVKKLNK